MGVSPSMCIIPSVFCQEPSGRGKNSSKLEGMCEWLYVCIVCTFKHETIPRGSAVITLIHCPLLLYPLIHAFYSRIPSVRGLVAAPQHACPQQENTGGGSPPGAHHYSLRQIGHPNQTWHSNYGTWMQNWTTAGEDFWSVKYNEDSPYCLTCLYFDLPRQPEALPQWPLFKRCQAFYASCEKAVFPSQQVE